MIVIGYIVDNHNNIYIYTHLLPLFCRIVSKSNKKHSPPSPNACPCCDIGCPFLWYGSKPMEFHSTGFHHFSIAGAPHCRCGTMAFFRPFPGPEGREHFVRRARGGYCELLSARGERGDGEKCGDKPVDLGLPYISVYF